MKNVILLTGSETRHSYFRLKVAAHPGINVIATYCEGDEKSLKNRTSLNPDASFFERYHVQAREQSERDFFKAVLDYLPDASKPKAIPKGGINDPEIVKAIEAAKPDLLVCYGSSLIKSQLLSTFEGRFLNVHLGLSPYYRGSGTNVWPLINEEPGMVGATFMYIDSGIDTGQIIHQIRADIFLGDGPHSIGNRLIAKMTDRYCSLICEFDRLTIEIQPDSKGKLYLQRDFDALACERLYRNFQGDMIINYIRNAKQTPLPYIVENSALKG